MRVGETALARQRLRECFAMLDRLDTPRERIFALEAVAELAAELGRSADAAKLLGAATGTRDALHVPRMPAEAADIERLAARVALELGADQAERMVAVGREWSAERLRAEISALLEGED
jgi:hypothetical protein